MLFDTLNLVVSISGFDSPKLESVTIPTSLPVKEIDFFDKSLIAAAINFIDNLSPNEIK